MKTQILFYAYALLSVFVGVIACSWLHWKSKRPRATAIAAAIFFGGPLLVSITMSLSAKSALSGYQADVAYMQELCAKYGGDKIYRTVDNVEGVFQMK